MTYTNLHCGRMAALAAAGMLALTGCGGSAGERVKAEADQRAREEAAQAEKAAERAKREVDRTVR